MDTELEFQKIYNSFRPRILRYLRRLVGEHEAEDLTQEVFLKVNKSLKEFKGHSQVSTWIYRITTNAALDRLRSPSFKQTAHKRSSKIPTQEIETLVEDKDVWTGQKTSSLEEMLIRKDMWNCIQDFVDKLPSNYRTVIVLSVFEGMKNKEIAKILGVTLETVKIRLHRGKSKLRKEFKAHCGLYRDARDELAWDGKRP